MSFKPYYFILFIIALSSTTSALLLYSYMNPESDPKLALSLMGLAVFLSGSSILSLLFFFIKKIYYRGEVYLATMGASVRQGIFTMIWLIVMVVLYGFSLWEMRLILMVWAAIWCLEIMIQAIE